jgi:hypothetical protein
VPSPANASSETDRAKWGSNRRDKIEDGNMAMRVSAVANPVAQMNDPS